MIPLDRNIFRLNQIAEEWTDRLRSFLTSTGHRYSVSYSNPDDPKEPLEEKCDTYQKKMLAMMRHSSIPEDEKPLGIACINRFCARLDFCAKASDEDMEFIQSLYTKLLENHETVQNELTKIFIQLYEDFSSCTPKDLPYPIAYHFFKQLNVRTCPYCNRTYTFTVYEANGKTRPEYDHFYDKSTHPLLAVSFYNLVPSCHICNHIKQTKPIGVNPYFDGFRCKFKVTTAGGVLLDDTQKFSKEEDLVIKFDSPKDAEKKNISNLALDQLYQEHEDYVKEIFEKAQAYNEHARKALVSSFQGANHSPQDVFDFVWGKNLETARQINRPLSKLTRDVLVQLGIIKEENITK